MINKSKLCPIAICLVIFESPVKILFVMKVKIFVLIQWSYTYPNHLTIELSVVSIY